MVSSVITSALATVPDMGARPFSDDSALIVVLTFLALVIQKETIGDARGQSERDLARGLNIGIVPLAFAFLWIVGDRLLKSLQ